MSEIKKLVYDCKLKDESEGLFVNSMLGADTYEKCILLSVPGEEIYYEQIIYMNLNDDEKEYLFNMLDENLHDKPYGQLFSEYIRVRDELIELRRKLPKEQGQIEFA